MQTAPTIGNEMARESLRGHVTSGSLHISGGDSDCDPVIWGPGVTTFIPTGASRAAASQAFVQHKLDDISWKRSGLPQREYTS